MSMRLILTFELADERYGIDIAEVQEIVEAPERYYIPNAPACYAGAINFHGAIVPVIDLPGLLGLAASALDHRVIVLRSNRCQLGLAVTRLNRILRFEVGQILPCEAERQRQSCIGELLSDADDMINLLDVSLLLERLETAPGHNQEVLDVHQGTDRR